MKKRGDVRFYDVFRLGLIAAIVKTGLAFLPRLRGNERPCRLREFRIELVDLGGLGGEGWIVFTPVCEEAALLLGVTFRGIC